MTKPLMGTNRSDNRESRCRAKDPDHCPFHKPGSHVPYDLDKMMRMNEKVIADEAKKAGRGGALRKSSINHVSSKRVQGSIFNSDTLNTSDMKFIARVGRRYAFTLMQRENSGDGDLQSHTDFHINDDPKSLASLSNETAEDMAFSGGHQKRRDSMYSALKRGTIAEAAGIKPDDDEKTAIRKGAKFISSDPKFISYMKNFQKEFTVHADDPAEEKYDSRISDRASTADGARSVIDRMLGRK